MKRKEAISGKVVEATSNVCQVVMPTQPMTSGERSERLPLSFAQQRLWFLSQMEGVSEAYHIPGGLRLAGRLDALALRRALDRIVARHEALRTSFGLMDGEPVQKIASISDSSFLLHEHDLRQHPEAQAELVRLTQLEASASFDLESGPLIRGRLLRLADEDHALLITMHHIVSDGWSMGIFIRELGALYGAFLNGQQDPLPELGIQYADYALWQRKWIEGDILRQQAEYWKTALAGAPVLLELPTDHPRPAQQSYAGAFANLVLDATLTAELKTLSRRHGTTLFMTLLAAWAVLLARVSGQQDIVSGTAVANRGRAEIEGLIGFFSNTLALRIDLTGSPTVSELLSQVKARSIAAQQHQDIPFEQVVELARPVRSLAHSPLFQVMFDWDTGFSNSLALPGLGLQAIASSPHAVAKFDLRLFLQEEGETIAGSLEYATALFEPATVERYLGHFRTLLQAMVADQTRPVDRLPLLSPAERHQLLYSWNDTKTEYPDDKCVHELFEEQVARTPEATAVIFEGNSLSYSELNDRANQLAHRLRELGVKPDVRVAICVERGFEMIIGLMAILKAGAAYVPLDPAYPEDRLRFMLEDSTPVALLTQQHLESLFAGLGDHLPFLYLDIPTWTQYPKTNLLPGEIGLEPHHLAYVIYTSGSTGKPKGVMIQHQGLCNYLSWVVAAYIPRLAVVTSSFSFDATITSLFGPLMCGGISHLLAEGDETRQLGMHIKQIDKAALVKITPAHLELLGHQSLAESAPCFISVFVVGGDVLSGTTVRLWRQLKPDVRLVNEYGPTESVVGCLRYEIPQQAIYTDIIPIGRPISNTQVYILDGQRQPVPIGVTGELYIGGAGVARGYLNRPELTAEKFLKDPFVDMPGARMYKTGDLGRWLPDGNIEFLGRNDFQVKIRGFRIELGEIEARLASYPAIREAVVIAREDTPGNKRLIAYYTATDTNDSIGAELLRSHVAATLPEYMVPAAYVHLESLPLTPNGKLDRNALPTPEAGAYSASEYQAPQGEIETALATIWTELLAVDRVGRYDNFFELGGHSLLAVQVIVHIQQRLNVEATISNVFSYPVLADLAQSLESAIPTDLPPMTSGERSERLPLSFAQQRLWFLSQMEGVSEAYHIPGGLRLAGRLDALALRRALDRIVARHEALRTSFGLMDGEPVQKIASISDSSFLLHEHDLRQHPESQAELVRLTQLEASASFDLESGPLIRGRLLRLADEDHALLITMHHIVSDGWSMGIFIRELGALYGAFLNGQQDPLPELGIQYADYALWQRKWIEGDILRQQAEYWKTALAGAPVLLELPTDHPRPAQQSYAGAFANLVLDATLTAELKTLSRRHGTTLFMTLLAAWAVLLARVSGQQDIVSGTAVANRGRAEIEGLIGFFSNTLALRIDLTGSPTVSELLSQVKARSIAAQQHQDIPFEQVVELARPVRSLAHSPLFQVMFDWDAGFSNSLALPGLGLQALASAPHAVAKFDLTLFLQEEGETIAGGLEYATALFEPATVERYLGHFRTLLQAMVADDTQSVDRLPLLSPAERHQLLYSWNDTKTEYPDDKCVHELFEEQVARTPEATAVIFEGNSLSYSKLNDRANQLAHRLRELGVKPDVRVAICVERGFEMIIGLMAILKAGAAYVPLDPAYPEDRLRFMLEDSTPVALLTQQHLESLFAGLGDHLPFLYLDIPTWTQYPKTNLLPGEIGLEPHHLAYVIYTSGSTGKPKGVMIQHDNLARLFTASNSLFNFGSKDVWTLFHSYAFDFSVWELWGALVHGGRLVVVSKDVARSPVEFYKLVCSEAVTVLNQTPSAFRQFLTAQAQQGVLHSLSFVIFGGEALETAMLLPWSQHTHNGHTRLVNMYGITETTVHVTYDLLANYDLRLRGNSQIGHRLPDLRVYILDGQRQPVPIGVTGELYIGGAGVARGYLNRPELTAEKFLKDPFVDMPGARMYKTGDLGRWLPDGNIEFLGRNDFQVKIRGFRIELGEIEARLASYPAIREAVVIAREDTPGNKRLIAYYTATDTNDSIGAELLRSHVAATLPEYMVPAAYVHLESLPLTPNGKLDRNALPTPEAGAYSASEYQAPQGEIETALATIWTELLAVDRVGRYDNFFELGGHSLLAVRLMTRIRQSLSIEISLRELFSHPVLADLARSLESAIPTDLPPMTSGERSERLPLSFAQQRLWFLSQMEGVSEAYHIPGGLRLAGRLDALALRRALDRIVARHEALRTSFGLMDGEPVQKIASISDSSFLLHEHDLRQHPEAQAELVRLTQLEASASFDLESGPLIRGRLLRLADEDHALLITMHHIVSDGWSMGIFIRELGALYGAFLNGQQDPLPELGIQYADYALWQRKWIEGDILRQQAEYWKTALAGAPVLLELPTDHPRPAQQSYAGAFANLVLDATLTAELKTLSRRHGTTLFMTLLAAWAVLLARVSGQQDIVSGTAVANRGRAEIEGLIGFFSNTLALRIDLTGSPTVSELLSQVKARSIAAQQHQDIPFEQVVELARPVRSLAHSPLFQVMFDWDAGFSNSLALPGLGLQALASAPLATAKFDLRLFLQEEGETIAGGLEYATALFEPATVERYLGHFRTLLQAMVADDTQSVDRLPLLSPAERHQLLYSWNDTKTEYPDDKCVHELFEEQVARTPEATAVIFEGNSLSYSELNDRANQLAHRLRELGVKPDVRVAICVERGFEMIIGLMAILKAGAAYVPLDPAYPEDRLRFMLEDSTPVALLTQQHLESLFAGLGDHLPFLYLDVPTWTQYPKTNLLPGEIGLEPHHLAYVIYTSGSTGKPKGVMIQHQGLCNHIAWQCKTFDVNARDVFLQRTSISFDASAVELYTPLTIGARMLLLPIEAARDPHVISEAITKGGVTIVQFVPSLLQLMFQPKAGTFQCRYIFCAGEPLSSSLANYIQSMTTQQLINMYGPTEATIDSTAWRYTSENISGHIPIGRPISNTQVYILDGQRQPVPIGVTGELYIGGAGVARGYLNRPELTAEKFLKDPFVDMPGARMYKTGDLGRWLPDGNIEFLGRNDFQVKIRGFRIELGEIEARLASYPAIREAVVIAREDTPGNKRLIAYYTATDTNDSIGAELLRSHVAATLPEYMVPAAYVHLESLPLTLNGKLDRNALPTPEAGAYSASEYQAPQGEIETALATIWTELLAVDRVGRYDNFFELGGHSLLAVTLIDRARRLGLQIDVRSLFARPTLIELASCVSNGSTHIDISSARIPTFERQLKTQDISSVTLELHI